MPLHAHGSSTQTVVLSLPCVTFRQGIRREAITCRNLAATQCLSDPGLYDDTIPEIQFFRELCRAPAHP